MTSGPSEPTWLRPLHGSPPTYATTNDVNHQTDGGNAPDHLGFPAADHTTEPRGQVHENLAQNRQRREIGALMLM